MHAYFTSYTGWSFNVSLANVAEFFVDFSYSSL